MLQQGLTLAFSPMVTDPELSIAPWSAAVENHPGNPDRLIRRDGFVTINRCREPEYRALKVNHTEFGATGELLEWMIPDPATRRHVIDWVAWNLQNENDKPAWTVFLYSKSKGTGKSVFGSVLRALFGEENSANLNGVSKLLQRFNAAPLLSKLVICEEVQIKQGSDTANSLKTLVTEPTTTIEQKGQEQRQIQQRCCFVFNTNRIPFWLEGDDRRHFVVDVDHDGHAKGPRAEEFQGLVRRVYAQIEDPRALGALYNALSSHEIAEDFNPKSLNTETHSTEVMKQIAANSRQASIEQLEEYLNQQGLNWISQEALIGYCQENGINRETIRHKMAELGWHRQEAKWGGVDYRRVLWLRQGYSAQRGSVIGPDGSRTAMSDPMMENLESFQ